MSNLKYKTPGPWDDEPDAGRKTRRVERTARRSITEKTPFQKPPADGAAGPTPEKAAAKRWNRRRT